MAEAGPEWKDRRLATNLQKRYPNQAELVRVSGKSLGFHWFVSRGATTKPWIFASWLVFRASLMIRGAEWASQGSSKGRVTRKRIAQERGLADGFAIRAYSELFCREDSALHGTGWSKSVKALWSFGMPPGESRKRYQKKKR